MSASFSTLSCRPAGAPLAARKPASQRQHAVSKPARIVRAAAEKGNMEDSGPLGDRVGRAWDETRQAAGDAASKAGDRLQGAVEEVGQQAKHAGEVVKENVVEGASAVRQNAEETGDRVKGRMGETLQRGNDMSDQAEARASGVHDPDVRERSEKIGARAGEAWDEVKGLGTEKLKEGAKGHQKGVDEARARAGELEDWTNN